MSSSVTRIDSINIGLMVASCAAALVAPFHVFLFAYAILGPLHYLTEISWLRDRKFFARDARTRGGWLLLVGATAAVVSVGFVSGAVFNRSLNPAVEMSMFLLVFVGAAIASYVRQSMLAVVLAGGAGAVLLMFSDHAAYAIVAYLLITVIHVFVFTAFFILAGAMKSRSVSGYSSLIVFFACAAAALVVPVPFTKPGAELQTVYAAFEQLNVLLLRMAGLSDNGVYEVTGVGVMRFIAFAYTYHYLNWFSKTSIIRWHEVSRTRGIAIAAAWIAGVALYFYSYRAGFAVFYVLSVVHVMLEFPLNHQTFVGLFRTWSPVASLKTSQNLGG